MYIVGTCVPKLNGTYECLCQRGWEGEYCERLVNYCKSIKCENGGLCRTVFLNYRCECVGTEYSGTHCEIISNEIIIWQVVGKSVAYVAILIICGTCLLVILMDILDFFLGIEVRLKVKTMKKEKKVSRVPKTSVIRRFIYVN